MFDEVQYTGMCLNRYEYNQIQSLVSDIHKANNIKCKSGNLNYFSVYNFTQISTASTSLLAYKDKTWASLKYTFEIEIFLGTNLFFIFYKVSIVYIIYYIALQHTVDNTNYRFAIQ